ncbi:MAG: hypothetical protein AAF907_05055 [Planctomycetota bacterium]
MLEHIPSPEGRTLREQVDTALKLSRELDEHVRQTLIPSLKRLREMVEDGEKKGERRRGRTGTLKVAVDQETSPQQADRAVRHSVDALLEADRFAAAKRLRLEQYCQSIRQALSHELSGGAE